jgi:hypothetical protein
VENGLKRLAPNSNVKIYALKIINEELRSYNSRTMWRECSYL